MDTFYNLVDFIYNNLSLFIDNLAVFMTTPLGDTIARIIVTNDFWRNILITLINVTDALSIYHLTPLEIMIGVGLPAVLIWTLIKWILPTS